MLKRVSRSFYLTLKILPSKMRYGVSLGYLLARASDTLADTIEVSVENRMTTLKLFIEVTSAGEKKKDLLSSIEQHFLPKQKNRNEKVLLQNISQLFKQLEDCKCEERELLKRLLIPICEGQMQDLEYFQKSKSLAEGEDLEHYCYLVAGCVGEFWTSYGRLCYGADFSFVGEEKLFEWGRNYGKSLQLVNILRDIEEDLELQRCYLPVRNVGDRAEILLEREKWILKAEEYLEDAFLYVKSLKIKRARIASAVPALLAQKTLDLLKASKDLKPQKVSRLTVYASLWKSFWI